MKTATSRHAAVRVLGRRVRLSPGLSRYGRRRPGWDVERLERRVVLSAPPVLGDVPAVLYASPVDPWSSYVVPVTDADTPASALTFTVVTDPATWTVWFGGNRMFYARTGADETALATLTVTDDSGLTDTASFTFAVGNITPSPMPFFGGPSTTTEVIGRGITFRGSASDTDDRLEAWWDFGDGVVTAPVASTSRSYIPFANQFLYEFPDLTHAYAQAGTFTATFFARDSRGAVGSKAFVVSVAKYRVDAAGVLQVGSTPGNDSIHVSPAAGGKTNLFLGGALQGVFAAGGVVAYGNEGDDVLDAAPDLAIPVEYHGGPGNDLLRGGAANDLLFGDGGNDGLDSRAGNDVLVGGDGNDIAFAGVGNDVLIGGLGSDSLYGETGDDVLVSGKTNLDGDATQLKNAVDAWNVQADYDSRTATIRLTYVTSIEDGANDVDWLWGGTYGVPDRDYFMTASQRTLLADRLPNERVN